MIKRGQEPDDLAQGLGKNRETLSKMAQSADAQRLMALLGRDGSVQQAAQAAAGGDASQLMGMVQKLMQSQEGADLVNRISHQAKQSGMD